MKHIIVERFILPRIRLSSFSSIILHIPNILLLITISFLPQKQARNISLFRNNSNCLTQSKSFKSLAHASKLQQIQYIFAALVRYSIFSRAKHIFIPTCRLISLEKSGQMAPFSGFNPPCSLSSKPPYIILTAAWNTDQSNDLFFYRSTFESDSLWIKRLYGNLHSRHIHSEKLRNLCGTKYPY